jgi:hypothetical protein
MKRIIVISVLVLIAGAAIGQTLKKGSILALRSYEIVLQPDATMNQFLDFWQNKYIPAEEKAWPGMKVFILKGDRGAHAQELGELVFFDSKESRDKLWPVEGEAGPYDEASTEFFAPIMEEGSKLVADSKAVYTDWIVLPVNTSADQVLQKGNLLGAHLIKPRLQPDVTMNQYLGFITEEYAPEFEKHMKGWKIFILKGDRGENKNEYLWLYWIESLDARDRYLDSEGNANEAGNKAFENVMPLYEEMTKLGEWSSTFTDWVIL